MHDISLIPLLITLVLLIVISGFFSGSETGMMSLNRYRLRHLAKQNHRGAKRVLKLLSRIDRLLGVILIGNTFANILASAIATVIAVKLWGENGVAISTVALTLVILIFAEIAPKTIAASFPERVAFIVSLPLKFLLVVLYPLVWLASFLANSLLGLFGFRNRKTLTEALSHEELRSVVHDASGHIPRNYQEMLLGILDLDKVSVEQIMVPRQEITGIDISAPWETICEQLSHSQYTRVPLYRGDIEQVIGMIHIRSILNKIGDEDFNIAILMQLAQSIHFIPEGTLLYNQLLHFRKAKYRQGLVVDEYGDIQGLVTLDDVLEEIVGEFTTDLADSSLDIQSQTDGSYVVDGSTTIRELNRILPFPLPQEGPNTLSGLLSEYLETIPPVGTCMKIREYPIEVMQVKDNMVKTARVYPRLPSPDA